MAGPTTLFQTGDHASRPAASAGCVLYWCTDHEIMYRSDGSAWANFQNLSTFSGSGIAETLLDAKGDMIAASAADTAAKVTVGTNGQALVARSSASAGVAWETPTGLLALTRYAPTSSTIYSTSSGTLADVDATNLSVAFTAPVSGNVIVRLSAWGDDNGGSVDAYWGLRESTTDLPGIARVIRSANSEAYVSLPIYVTGISAGSHTYKWSFATGGTGTHRIIIQDGSATGEWGPGMMEVWAAP